MKVLVQTQGYLTLVANHRATIQALVYDFNIQTLPDSSHFVTPSPPPLRPRRAR